MELVRSLVAATVGGLLFERLGVPAGALIGAMVGVAVVGLGGFETTGSYTEILTICVGINIVAVVLTAMLGRYPDWEKHPESAH